MTRRRVAPALLLLLGIVGIAAAGQVQVAAVALPAYGASYQESGGEVAKLLQEILAEQKRTNELLRQILDQGNADPGGPTVSAPKADPTPAFKAECFRCHNARDAERKGGDFALFDDRDALRKLTRPERAAVAKVLKDGSMPPPPAKPLPPNKALMEGHVK